MTAGKSIRVSFMHPRSSESFQAEIGPATTGQQALEGLIQAKFLELSAGGRPYALQNPHSGKTIPASSALVAEGIVAGDEIGVVQTNVSARL